jgi:hypothetical protein
MKNLLVILVSIFFITSSIFAQEVASMPSRDTTLIHSRKPVPKTQVYSEPQTLVDDQTTSDTSYNTIVDNGIQFGLAGMLGASFQNWEKLQTDKSKLGFGIAGDLFAGIKMDDLYFGLGPHLGYSFWTTTETVSGYRTSGTWDVGDYGFQFISAWDEFFLTFGMGSAAVSVTATVGGDSETVDMPEDANYNRVGFGWYDGFLVALTYTSYKDWASNLGRLEVSFGYGF